MLANGMRLNRGKNAFTSSANLEDIDKAEKAAAQQKQGDDVHLSKQSESALAGHISQSWERNKLHKYKISQQMLSCLRARRGVYSQAELGQLQNNGGVNIVWVDLTDTKCRAASAWIRDVIMPTGERAWAADPTPIADLPVETKNAIVKKAATQAREAMGQAFQAGGDVMTPEEFKQLAVDIGNKLKDQTLKEFKKRAEAAAHRMSDKIADEMAQGDWDRSLDEFTEDFVTYPGAVLKGPFYHRKRELKWLPGFVASVTNAPRMQWARVSPFDVYPAPYATDCQDGDFIERIRLQPKELYDCIGLEGYNDEQIRLALREYRRGHLEGWIWTDAERYRLEQETLYTFLSPAGVIDGLHYWGSVPGWMLITYGIEGIDPDDLEKEYEVEIIKIGSYIIRCTINKDPLHKRPYWKACYDAIPGAFWGRSIPDLCKPAQRMVNAIACAFADNLGMASGPMVWVHADRFADGEDSTSIFPWRIWQLKSDAAAGTNPGIGFFQANPLTEQLMAALDKWEIKADDATGIPRYTYGNERIGGAGDTASGLSMLMNSAAKGLRRAISNIDMNVIAPTVYATFIYLMLYDKDLSIKGDCVIVPRGANAILIKEASQQHRREALQLTVSSEVLIGIAGKKGIAELFREVLKSLDIDPDSIVPNEEEMEAQMQQEQQMQQQMMQQQQAAMQQQQQLEMQKTQSANETRLAEKQIDATTQKEITGAKIAGELAKNQGVTSETSE